jgi:hypothetical protein
MVLKAAQTRPHRAVVTEPTAESGLQSTRRVSLQQLILLQLSMVLMVVEPLAKSNRNVK